MTAGEWSALTAKLLREAAEGQSALLDVIVELTIERDGHALLARQAIHALHAEQAEVARLREQVASLRNELRRYVAAQFSEQRAA